MTQAPIPRKGETLEQYARRVGKLPPLLEPDFVAESLYWLERDVLLEREDYLGWEAPDNE